MHPLVHVSQAQISTVSRRAMSHSDAVTVEQVCQPLLPSRPSRIPLKSTHRVQSGESQPSFYRYQNCVYVCVFTVRCCMISCSRAVLASSWLWSGVCCSSIDRICPSCGSSSSFISPTCNNCRTIRNRRGMELSAVTQAVQTASLQMSHKGVLNY